MGTKGFLTPPCRTGFQAEPDWLILYISATKEAQLLQQPMAMTAIWTKTRIARMLWNNTLQQHSELLVNLLFVLPPQTGAGGFPSTCLHTSCCAAGDGWKRLFPVRKMSCSSGAPYAL